MNRINRWAAFLVVVGIAAVVGFAAYNLGVSHGLAQNVQIFDRFYTGGTSHGSGLGLTIARNLVMAHGGDIHAESEVGRGTTITFTLPVDLLVTRA